MFWQCIRRVVRVAGRTGRTPVLMTWVAVVGAALVAGALLSWLPGEQPAAAELVHNRMVVPLAAGLLVIGFVLGPLQALRRERCRGVVALIATVGMIWLLGLVAWQAYVHTRSPDGTLRTVGRTVWAALDGREDLSGAAAAVGAAASQVIVEPHRRALEHRTVVGERVARLWGMPRRLAEWLWAGLWVSLAAVPLLYRRVWRWLLRVEPAESATALAGEDRMLDLPVTRPQRADPHAFNGLVGVEDAVEVLQAQMAAWLWRAEAAAFGVRPARGILLYGPPGTGKTSLARGAAQFFGVPFLVVSTTDMVGRYVGTTEEKVRGAFAQARRLAPCVVFVDELDAVGRSRDGRHLNRPADLALPVLLQELDGFHPLNGVLVVAATNRVDALDPALLRRFIYKVEVGLPDTPARALLLERSLAGLPLAVDLMEASRRLGMHSPADLENLCQVVRQRLWTEYLRTGKRRAVTWADLERGASISRLAPGGCDRSRKAPV